MKFVRARKLQFGFGALVLIMFAIGGASYRGLLVSASSERLVQHSHEVLEHLAYMTTALENIEACYQEYVLAGDDSFLPDVFCEFCGSRARGGDSA